MAQERTGPRADAVAFPLGEPVDWEHRIALARVRREAALAQRPPQQVTLDPRPLQPRAALPQRGTRTPPPRARAAETEPPHADALPGSAAFAPPDFDTPYMEAAAAPTPAFARRRALLPVLRLRIATLARALRPAIAGAAAAGVALHPLGAARAVRSAFGAAAGLPPLAGRGGFGLPLGAASALVTGARANPAPVAALAAGAALLTVAAVWMETRPATVETAALRPDPSVMTDFGPATATGASDAVPEALTADPAPPPPPNARPRAAAPPADALPVAPRASVERLALPATGYGARVRDAGPGAFRLTSRTAPADLATPPAGMTPREGVDPGLLRGLVATALAD